MVQQLESPTELHKPSPPVPATIAPVGISLPKNKPSLMKQPNTIIPQKTEETTHRLTLVVEENKPVPQLRQIATQVKKAISLLSDNSGTMVQQLKPILNKISNICNTGATRSITTTTTKSSEIIVSDRPPTRMVHKRVNVADSHREIQK